MSCEYDNVTVSEDQFGFLLDKTTGNSSPVRRFTWRNGNDITVQMISYGATITSIKIPDKHRTPDDIVMGFDDMQGYLNPLNPYFGATVGRVANRIGNSRINIDQVSYKLNANLGQHQLHGGFKGFDKVNWDCYVNRKQVVFSYDSPDGEEGYPGNVLVNLVCELKDNAFSIEFKATTTKPTFVNLTNHSYFNLAGHNKGSDELYKHVVCINANKITDVDDDFIPNGRFNFVANTIFDLQTPKILKDVIKKVPKVDGYDHNFCINKGSEQGNAFVARVEHPDSGRVLEVYSNQPGVQFYTTNSIGEVSKNESKPMKALKGKNGSPYVKHGAFCLETQNYPDAINHENFPKAVLYPGETYNHSVIYKFLTK